MQVFFLIWFGEAVSLIGSGLTRFALGVWVYQQTGSATHFAMLSLAAVLPGILLSPLAGALADRYHRGRLMIFGNTGAGLGTLIIVFLLFSGEIHIWHLYLVNILSSSFSAFQWPAFTASVTLLVPRKHLGRASGMTQGGEAVAQLISPALSGMLMGIIGIKGILLTDCVSFLFALVTLLVVRIPDASKTAAEDKAKASLLVEAVFGWKYICTRPGLFGLLVFFFINNFFSGVVNVLITPLGLSITSVTVLGTILSVGGIGFVAGALVMSVWGGPKRLILGVLGFSVSGGLWILIAGMHTYVPLLGCPLFFIPSAFPLLPVATM